ncbi:MAG: phosphate signaling complex protein PhoU [Candidatus Cloacimonas sp.]
MLNERIYELKKTLLEEAGLVEKMVVLAMEELVNFGKSYQEEVNTLENKVNKIEIDLDDKCLTLIALNQPEAKDLRQILMIYRINNDLERLGDQAVNIAESAAHLMGNPVLQLIPELFAMQDSALKMLKDALTAFTTEDNVLSHQVCDADNVVDDYNRKIYRHLIELIQANPLQTDLYLHILRIAKNLERIGDLSTNIAENTIFLAQGKVIKHNIDKEFD